MKAESKKSIVYWALNYCRYESW